MRVSFVLPGFNLAGGARVVLMFADYLRRAGHQPFVIALSAAPAWFPRTHCGSLEWSRVDQGSKT